MSMAGYSGTPLIKKLGIKPESRILLVNEPSDYYQLLEHDISRQLSPANKVPDLVHVFVLNTKEFESAMKKIQSMWKKNPSIVIWVSWYKKSARISTDITEDVIRNWALKNGLVDVKVCAVNEVWSGLKLVVPVAKR